MRKTIPYVAILIFMLCVVCFPNGRTSAQGNVSLSGNNEFSGNNIFDGTVTFQSMSTINGNMTINSGAQLGFAAGTSENFTEGSAAGCSSNHDLIWGDSSAHRLKQCNNGGSADTVVGAATTDILTNKTLTSPIFTSPQIVDGSFGSALTSTATGCETNFGATTLSTGSTTTTTGVSCLPANSIIDAVVARVTTTITSACTGWELGDGTTAARFSSNNTGLTAGTTTDAAHIGTFNNTGIASATTGIWQASAHAIVVTCAGGNPGAGAIRIIVYSHSPTAPTS